MNLKTVEERKKRILQLLEDDGVSTIILRGDVGMGKTWMAREISECAVNEGLCYATLWVAVTEKYDVNLLRKVIARRFSPTSVSEEWEDEEENEEQEEKESFEQMVRANLEKKRRALHKETKKLLLIVDDEVNTIHQSELRDNLFRDLKEVLPFIYKNLDQNHLKIIMTRRKMSDGHISEQNTKVLEFGPLSQEGSLSLLRKRFDRNFSEVQDLDVLIEAIAKKSMDVPAAITVIAEALNYIARHGSGEWTLGSALEAAAYYEKAAEGVNPLLCCGYDMLESTITKSCFWHSVLFLPKYGSVHYNELIAHWIMEGCFDPFDHIDEAYKKGYDVVTELLDRGLLKILEDNKLVLEGAIKNMVDSRPRGFCGTASMGLFNVFSNNERSALDSITHIDGMIRTLSNPKTWKGVSTLLIDGIRLSREVHKSFFNALQELQILAIFNCPSSFESVILPFEMQKLLVLVLRNCYRLVGITDIQGLKSLTALEISGESSLESLPNTLFDEMGKLRSLNLSGLQLKQLPPSLSNLRELRWLILRGCTQFKTLPNLKGLANLEVLDLSDATSFKDFPGGTLSFLPKIQMVDFSNTKIASLPKFHQLNDLTRILLRGCQNFFLLPSVKQLPSLQILDVSGAIKFKTFNDRSIANNKALRILDLSKTSISKLPSLPGNLFELNLSGCSELQSIPSTAALRNLERLDVSNAPKLATIEDTTFQHLKYLRYINFSKSGIEHLPSLSNLSNLHQLLLKDCPSLKNLPEMEGVTKLQVLDISGCQNLVDLPNLTAFQKLEVLDVSGCSALKVAGTQSFERMSRLKKLNLDQCGKKVNLDQYDAKTWSEIAVESLKHMTRLEVLKLSGITKDLPSISMLITLTNLSQLSLRESPGLKSIIPSLETLPKLETLDLSGNTAIASLPSLEKLSNLRELQLSGCLSLKELPPLKSLDRLEFLNLSKTAIQEFPYEISELTSLKSLVLPNSKIISEAYRGKIKRLPEDVKWGSCDISKPAENEENGRTPSVKVSITKFLQLLKEYPDLKDACFKDISFSILPSYEQSSHIDEDILSKIYCKTRHIPCDEKDSLSLEIGGFNSFPKAIKDILKHTTNISLSDINSMKYLSDLGDVADLTEMEGCWLERCPEVESIFGEETDVKLGENLKTLWVSSLPNLTSLCSGRVQSMNFMNLTFLYLDCCPKLGKVFSSSHFPEKLEVLKIKYCDNLETVFEPNENESKECTFPSLRTLLLYQLPELISIGASMPVLQNRKIDECPKLSPSTEIVERQK